MPLSNFPGGGPPAYTTRNYSAIPQTEAGRIAHGGRRPKSAWKSLLPFLAAVLLFNSVIFVSSVWGGNKKRTHTEDGDVEHEELIYRKAGIHWDAPEAEHCIAYHTRQYTSRLLGIPFGYDWHKACAYTPITINNKTIEEPDKCDDWGLLGMYGRWAVEVNDLSCKPYWEAFKDTGCSGFGSGKRRIGSHLADLQTGDNWMAICSTTPATIHGTQYSHPTYCTTKGLNSGMYGIWDVDDPRCR